MFFESFQNILRRISLGASVAGACGLLFLTAHHATAAERRPNIVFILADDLGWTDLGCYGSTFYETPSIDALAADGMKFQDAYAACCVCSPTRAAILTGKYPARLRLTDWLPGQGDSPSHRLNRPKFQMSLPLSEVTLAESLKEAGYETGFFGKWHLGEDKSGFPEHQGFDVNVGGCATGHPPSYFSPYRIPTLTDGPKGEYLNERLTREAVRFIETCTLKGQPFFLYFSQYAVHTPLQAKPEVVEKYRKKAESLGKSGPEFNEQLGRKVRQIQRHPVYGAMVESLDDSVGKVMASLMELGIEDNTIVVFTSDNGGLSTSEGTPTANLPLHMGKGWAYEGGVREPLIIKWPKRIASGSTNACPVISTDFYPTLLEAAGVPLKPAQHLDGKSILPVLEGGSLPERPLFWHYPHYSNQGGSPHGVVRLGDYKLIEWYEDMRVELYQLARDQDEKNDLAKELPDKTGELRKLLHDWREQVNAQMPTPNPDFKP